MMNIIMMVENVEGRRTKRADSPKKMITLKEKISSIKNSKCLITMRGLSCPTTANQVNSMQPASRNNQGDLLIVAGVGYSHMDRTIHPQIIKSPQAVPISPINSQKIVRTVKSAAEYFQMLFPNENDAIFNGLYSHGSVSTDMIFSKFFDGNLHIVDMQKQFMTHQVEISSIQVTEDFKEIINLLPDQMDYYMYMQVISSFGDSVAVKVTYGGVVDMTNSVKSCYNDPNMEKYLDFEFQHSIDETTDTSTLPSGYMRYHKMAQLDIVGGNPTISSIKERIRTFARNPVPVRLETIPIWRVFPDGPKQSNMKKVYKDFMASVDSQVSTMTANLKEKMYKESLKPQPFKSFQINQNTGVVEDLGSKLYIAAGETKRIDSMFQFKYYVMFPNIEPSFQGALKLDIHRNMNGSFYVDFFKGECDNWNTNCRFPPSAQIRNYPKPLDMFLQPTRLANNECLKINLKLQAIDNWIADYVYVCNGCMPLISADAKNLSCSCPYIE